MKILWLFQKIHCIEKDKQCVYRSRKHKSNGGFSAEFSIGIDEGQK